jgi:signal transduction histidine kinase
LSYQRYADIALAEAQLREAQIEAALERVRARTMAMQRSEELLDVASILFQQVKALGVPQWNCGFNIWEIGDKEFIYYPGTPDGIISQSPCKIPLTEHPVFQQFDASRKRGDELLIYEKEGEMQRDHYRYMLSLPGVGDLLQSMLQAGFEFPSFQIDHVANFAFGNLIFITFEHFPQMHDVFKRFARVFEQTYTRFLDLQKAEAQALEAIKRASVDRVRAEIASMRTTSDLDRIQPLIWNELKTLDVPFIRCGVFIMDEAKQELQAFLSTPDGKSIAAFHLPYHSTDQSKQIVAHWQQKKIFKDHMDEKAFADYTKNLVQQGAVASNEKYVTENRPTDLYLHFLPFFQGRLYVGNDAPLNDDELQLVQNLADAFSTAYARYEDFNKLDLAKTAVENAMNELKATQSQLVQQEKLASLGQLTAGIAHEIKNPLNFVNNFSEVSIELIDEVLEEIEKKQDKRDETLISDILKDIRSNVQKVHDHGYRANSIVTSMLQHSRGGTGKMNPTDLNALIKEYVNLSYHGMRASKTPMDVDIVLDLHPALGMVSLIKEDFTRVVINLSNNAFDAMREKIKTKYEVDNANYEVRGTKDEEGEEHRADYKPTLSIQTRLEGGKVLIQFGDNGPGIPDEIKDKILQPFFTTKKGTEGTGLGLSITNDIVKAHGGQLKVETKEGEGSTFIISL